MNADATEQPRKGPPNSILAAMTVVQLSAVLLPYWWCFDKLVARPPVMLVITALLLWTQWKWCKFVFVALKSRRA